MLDQAIQSSETRFEQLKNHVNLLGFLTNFQNIHMAEIRKQTLCLEAALTVITIKHDAEGKIVTEIHKGVDGNLLAEELEALKAFSSFQN